MNEIVTVEAGAPRSRLSITAAMAAHYSMEQDTFLATMRATVFAKGMSREEEAAFLLVARHHNLNPVTREIYAMPKKGGGIIPVVGIDGWVRMTNEHPAFDGMTFESDHEGEKLVSTTCQIFRKDRSHPIVVTEYLAECYRETEPWKMKHRMLRHKAMIQCARYAFGFAGIYDPDEAERFAEPLVGGNAQRRVAPPPAAPMIEHQTEQVPVASEPTRPVDRPTAEKPQEPRRAPSAASAPEQPAKPPAASPFDPEKVRARFSEALKTCKSVDQINDAWMQIVDPVQDDMMPPDRDDLEMMVRARTGELGGGEEWSEQ